MTLSWTRLTETAPVEGFSEEYGAQLVWFGGFFWLIGGSGDPDNFVYKSVDATTWALVTATPAWTANAQNWPVVSFDGKMWLFDFDGYVWTSTDGETWAKATTAVAPYGTDKSLFSCVVFDSKMWIIGADYGAQYESVWHTTDGIDWTEVVTSENFTPSAASIISRVAVLGDTMFCVKGSTQTGASFSVFSSTDGETWTVLVPDVIAARSGYGMVVHENKLTIFGGLSYAGGMPVNTNSVLTSSDGLTWAEETPEWSIRSGFAYLSANSQVILMATSSPSSLEGEVWITGTYAEPPLVPEVSVEWEQAACVPYGDEIDLTPTVSPDFNRIMILDLKNNAIYPGYGFPFACSMANTSPCAGVAQTPSSQFVGGTDGYFYKAFMDSAPGLGINHARSKFALTADSTASVLAIDADAEGTFFEPDFLIGLPFVVEYAAGGTSSGFISDNDEDTITLENQLAIAPTTGDFVRIAPMSCGILFSEMRFKRPASVSGLEMNLVDNQTIPQDFTLEAYRSAGAENAADLTTPAATREFESTDTQKGTGRIAIQPKAGKAQQIALRFQPTGGGWLQIESAQVEVGVHPSEAGR